MGKKKHLSHNEVTRVLTMSAKGKSAAEIEQATGRSKTAILKARKDYKDVLEAIRESYKLKILKQVGKSVQTIAELRDKSKNDSVRLKASQDILDRAEGQLAIHKENRLTMNFKLAEKPTINLSED